MSGGELEAKLRGVLFQTQGHKQGGEEREELPREEGRDQIKDVVNEKERRKRNSGLITGDHSDQITGPNHSHERREESLETKKQRATKFSLKAVHCMVKNDWGPTGGGTLVKQERENGRRKR